VGPKEFKEHGDHKEVKVYKELKGELPVLRDPKEPKGQLDLRVLKVEQLEHRVR
jgi:hypothetical protein